MEASKRMVCAMVIMALLLVGSAEADCTVENSSGKDILILPVGVNNVRIKVKAGAVVKLPAIYLDVIIKNLGTGHKSVPTKLSDNTVVVFIDGIVKGTVDLYLGSLLNGIITLITGSVIIGGI